MNYFSVFTDGGAKGNPGPAAIGVHIKIGHTDIIRYREDIGVATNNEAEYTAVVRAIEKLIELKPKHTEVTNVEFFADSLLVVEQLKGKWKIKEARLRQFVDMIHEKLHVLSLPCSFTHIPREKNSIADGLVNGKD